MNQETAHSASLNGSQPTLQDQTNSRRMRSSSIREQIGSDREDKQSRISSTTKSDVNSESSRYNKARGPINDAVHSVLDPLDPTHATIPPEVLSQLTTQITASVLEQLKAAQLSPQSAPATGEHMDSISSMGGSPPIDRDKNYTPPSPYRASEEAASRRSPTSPRKQTEFSVPPEIRRPPSPPFSHATLSDDSDAKEGKARRWTERGAAGMPSFNQTPIESSNTKEEDPTSRAERTSTDGGATLLETIWGSLFDEQGHPTVRLSQFLRGIAVHLIEDYEPKHSLVISPDKMQRYYEETKLSQEIYPWQVIFDDRTSSISRMFREVEAQHHLIQDRLDERPDIPGLTPLGFETWMALVLKAHPDQEFERLAFTALHMPISNPDDRKERFPKELSRRQFPTQGDNSSAIRLQKLMLVHCGVNIPIRHDSIDERDKTAQSSFKSQTTPLERSSTLQTDTSNHQTNTRSSIPSDFEKNVLRPTVSETAANEPTGVFIPPQIERERKPYAAQPGGGKYYDNIDTPITQPAESRASHSAVPPAKITRSNSMSSNRPSESRSRPTQPVAVHQKPSQMPPQADGPPPTRTRAGSLYHRDGTKRDNRGRSPSSSRTNGMPIPPRPEADVSYGTGSYHSSTSADYAPNSYRSDNRYDRRTSIPSEQWDRDREPRQRYQSMNAGDGHRHYKDYPSEDENHRPGNASFSGTDPQYAQTQVYPPNSYRSRA